MEGGKRKMGQTQAARDQPALQQPTQMQPDSCTDILSMAVLITLELA